MAVRSSSSSYSTDVDDDGYYSDYHYYRYNHGTGEHVLVNDKNNYHDRPPKYSLHCLFCYCVDCFCLLLVLGFLGFSFWLCYYLYNNYSGGG